MGISIIIFKILTYFYYFISEIVLLIQKWQSHIFRHMSNYARKVLCIENIFLTELNIQT